MQSVYSKAPTSWAAIIRNSPDWSLILFRGISVLLGYLMLNLKNLFFYIFHFMCINILAVILFIYCFSWHSWSPSTYKIKMVGCLFATRAICRLQSGLNHKGAMTSQMIRPGILVCPSTPNEVTTKPTQSDVTESDDMDDWVASTTTMATFGANSNIAVTSPDLIRAAGHSDPQYIKLIKTIQRGFSRPRSLTAPEVCEYWEVRHRLSVDNDLALLGQRIIIPTSQRTKILHSLYSAHQGEVGTKAHANESVYWPGMNASIRITRLAVSTNSVGSIPCGGGQTYLACADRLTGWLIIQHLNHGQANASRLISICRDIFQTYGAPEELSSDGGPPFKSSTFTQFHKNWAVKHRLSSAAYPQSNGRAELAVKMAKRIIIGNTGAEGSWDNDRAARAILQYRNTPIQNIGLSPAQLLLHRQLHDFVPSQPTLYKPHAEWIAAARNREKSLSQRNARLIEKYNCTTHTLCPLLKGQIVSIQCTNNGQWSTTGQVIETLPHNIREDNLVEPRLPQETRNPGNPTSNSMSF